MRVTNVPACFAGHEDGDDWYCESCGAFHYLTRFAFGVTSLEDDEQ